MVNTSSFHIAVLPGDGIGLEVLPPCLEILRQVQARIGGFELSFEVLPAGAGHYRDQGIALPEETLKRAGSADAMLLGAMGLPDVRYPDGREISPQLDIRELFELFAGLRPVRHLAGLPARLSDPRAEKVDFVLVRESTEGLFASRGKTVFDGDEGARDFLQITREACERLFEFSFDLARKRRAKGSPGRVTCVDKANVLGSFAFFRKIFDECAARNPDVESEHCYVDAMALNLIRNPWVYDVVVTENLLGDILSDAGAALMGGMGMAPSGDVGCEHALFQPCHGTAPDIFGSGKANPTAMYLSAAMMLDWLGERHSMMSCIEAANLLNRAVERAFADGGLVPWELGGRSGLREVTNAVMNSVQASAPGPAS